MRVTIVCENTVGRPLPLLGEHGFACLVDSDSGRLLFDTGCGTALLHNLDVLGIAPESIDAVALSHGHDDHTGGLLPLLQRIGPRPVYAHQGIFVQRYFAKGEVQRDISMRADLATLEAAGARWRFFDECVELARGLWFSGPIPRLAVVETGDPSLVIECGPGKTAADPFADDVALSIESAQGLVVLMGCAHAGVINTLEHFMTQLGKRPVHAILGGMHLGPASEEQFMATVDYLSGHPGVLLGVSHCTGQERGARLYGHFPGQVFFASAGTTFEAA